MERDEITERYIRAGKHLHDLAKAYGWLDDGEGAWEFLSSLTYNTGYDDALRDRGFD